MNSLASTHHHAEKITVSLGERSYQIEIGAAILNDVSRMGDYLSSSRVALVTNDTLWPIYGEQLTSALRACDIDVLPIVLPDGEAHKDWTALNQIFDALLEHACDRKTTLIALGGGVIGDIAGFAAATYQRGVPFIQIPTTLLAQVDSSVGGKTAINHPLGKNMIGAFYQPQLVLADTATLDTLPDREFRSGLAEVIKYGLILDATFFTWLETNIDALHARDHMALTYAIKRSCEIKAEVVASDERETAKKGGRALLNLGHTFGHAIETALGYGTWLHGEAVACGMTLAANFSCTLGRISSNEASRAVQLLVRAGLPTQMPDIAPAIMLEHMGRDKKNEAGNIKLILLDAIGRATVDTKIPAHRIAAFLQDTRTSSTTI
jgi:3-dehydroquinate synthase